jgi:hypothetical protein
MMINTTGKGLGAAVADELEWDVREPLDWSGAVALYGVRWARALEVGGFVKSPEARSDGWIDVAPRFVAGSSRWGEE